jgi:hypothetical protein
MKKRGTHFSGSTILTIPLSLIEMACQARNKSIQEYLAMSRFKNQVRCIGEKLKIEIDTWKSFFEIPLKSIYDFVQTVLV